jgi:TolB-like protein/tetratricopeptide (TPR) repeat protein/tRNA A-37 threonylcarbamoyl transferase component Bud32
VTPAPDQLVAALADRYRIERELGQGGMATVYLAQDIKHDRQVAVKVLKPELGAVLGVERFLAEIRVTANLRHPHILPLYDSGDADGHLFYVMPFVEGESLRDRLDREKQLPVDTALQIAREVADALSYAHSRGVIHRDIKPGNILLESGHAVVADFGIAKAVRAAGGESLTQTGMSLGTPAYMSPEQAAGEQDLDGRSDLYALACVLYEMLAGQPPFTGPTAEALVRQHMVVDAPPVTNYRPAVPPPVAAALQRALAKAPADRFNPVAQFSEALRVGEGAAATTPKVATARDNKRMTFAAATLALIALLATFLVWRRGSVAAPTEAASVAVLPFVDLSPDRTNAYLGDGMAETLINALTNVAGLSVAARTSAFSFRDKREDVREIGRQLGVAAVLEGSVQKSGDRLRVTAQLIKTSNGLHLWSQNFDRSAGDIFAVQDEVARAVVTALQGKLVAQADTTVIAGGTRNPAAYDAYLLGRFYWNKRTTADMVRAAEYFEKALRADSTYAQAWSGLADSYVLFGPAEYAVPGINQDSILTLAERAARRAIAIAPKLGEARTSLAEILEYRNRWQEAADAFQQGIQLSPRYATGHQWYSYDLMIWNRWDEAIKEMERARELDPLSYVIVVSLAATYDGGDRGSEAPPLIEQADALNPGNPLTFQVQFAHDMILRQFEQAASDYRRYLVATGTDSAEAADIERRLRDPALRTPAFRKLAEPASAFGVLIHRVLDGDDVTIAYLAGLVKSPTRESIGGPALYAGLGPKLRADPRVQNILAQLRYPRPQDFGKRQ